MAMCDFSLVLHFCGYTFVFIIPENAIDVLVNTVSLFLFICQLESC